MQVSELIAILETMRPEAIVSFSTETREIVLKPEMVVQEIYGTQSFVSISEVW
jgi:hypothetical protein